MNIEFDGFENIRIVEENYNNYGTGSINTYYPLAREVIINTSPVYTDEYNNKRVLITYGTPFIKDNYLINEICMRLQGSIDTSQIINSISLLQNEMNLLKNSLYLLISDIARIKHTIDTHNTQISDTCIELLKKKKEEIEEIEGITTEEEELPF